MGKVGRPRKYSYETEEIIINHYIDDNWSYKQIEDVYKINGTMLWKICILHGRKRLVPFGNTKILVIKEACNFTYKQILSMAIDNHMTKEELFDSLELNDEERKKFSNYISVRGYNNLIPSKLSVSRNKGKIARDMIDKGYSLEEIASYCNWDLSYLLSLAYNWKSNKLIKNFKYNRIKIRVNSKMMKNVLEFIKNGDKTYIDICNEFGVAYNTVIVWKMKFKEMGIDFPVKKIKSGRPITK